MTENESFVSLGNANEDEMVTFYENENGTPVLLSKSNVLSVNQFYKVAKYFLETNTKSPIIKWMSI